MKKIYLNYGFLILICISSSMALRSQTVDKSNNYAITNVSIVDVDKGCILDNKTIIIKFGIIQEITSNTLKKELSGLTIIDGTGHFIIPGLFDSHVHYIDPETFGPMMISYGITFVREMGNETESAINQRNSLNSGKISAPEMITTGSILDGNPPFIPQISFSINTADEGRILVQKQIKSGVNQIKTYSNLRPDVFYAIIDECQKNNIKAVGHVPETIYIEDAAKAGLSSSEHFFGFGNVLAKVLNEPLKLNGGGMGNDQSYFVLYSNVNKEKLQHELGKISSYGMAVCPTTVVMKCATNFSEIFNRKYSMMDYVSPNLWDIWQLWISQKEMESNFRQLYPGYVGFLKDLYDAKFTMLIGTDLSFAGVIPGYSVHEEMAIWQEAGIPAIDILRSATITPAKFIGVDKSLGTIEKSKKASFIILSDNPLKDIKNTQKIEGVFLRGEYFNRQKLDSLKLRVKEANENEYNVIKDSNRK